MKFEKTIYVGKGDVAYVNEVMAITDETDPKWEDYQDLKDCTLERFTACFENGYEADISVCSGTSNFFIDPVLFNSNGHETCVLDCADELLGDYEFEDEGDEYIVHVVENPEKLRIISFVDSNEELFIETNATPKEIKYAIEVERRRIQEIEEYPESDIEIIQHYLRRCGFMFDIIEATESYNW